MDKETNQNIVHLLNQRTRLLAKEVNNELNDYGLYASQWSIIFCIDRFGPMSQTAIWKYLNVEAPTITRTLARMEKSGWIIRKPGDDKRERIIELTKEAQQKFSTIQQTMNLLEEELLKDLSTNEKEQLQYLLSKIAKTRRESTR